MENELKNIKAKIEQYKAEYNAAAASLEQKTSEAEGLAEGVRKYKDNQQMLFQLKPLLMNKYNEIKEINSILETITKKAKNAKLELDALFNNINNDQQIKQSKVISVSTTSEKMISQVMHEKKTGTFAPIKAPILTNKPVVAKEEPKIEITENIEQLAKGPEPTKTVINSPKTVQKKTLNDVAKSEASAQEKYLQSKAQNHRSFGQA